MGTSDRSPAAAATAPDPARSPTPAAERDRKAEHIDLALERRMQAAGSPFEAYHFTHEALPEIAGADIDLGVTFLGRRLRAPLLVSCMTGGTELARRINRNLAIAAEATGVALGVGSQRKALEDPSQVPSFQVRRDAPSVPLLANLGAVQLNYGYGLEACQAAVDMIEADALALHLNVLQEAIQPEGQTDFRQLLPKIGEVVRGLAVPVVVKEIGCGISRRTGEALHAQGVRILDTAGLGGTSWARIEAARADEPGLGDLFATWGIPTPESIRALRPLQGLTLIGSGGLRSGLDAAKAIALGADLVGIAQPFLEAAIESPARVITRIERLVRELSIAMLCLGARTVAELQRVPLAGDAAQ